MASPRDRILRRERVGATNPFIAQTREELERMKTLLVEEPAEERTTEAPVETAGEPDRS